MSNLTKPPILDDTGQDILTALGAIKQNLPQGGGSNGYAPTDATEATLADDDKVPFYDTSASGKRNSTWANIKAKLKAYFDGIYAENLYYDELYEPSQYNTNTHKFWGRGLFNCSLENAPNKFTDFADAIVTATNDHANTITKLRVEKTLAEFNALTPAEQDDPEIVYYIPDKPSLGYPVQDDGSATDLTDGALATGRTLESWIGNWVATNGVKVYRKQLTNVSSITISIADLVTSYYAAPFTLTGRDWGSGGTKMAFGCLSTRVGSSTGTNAVPTILSSNFNGLTASVSGNNITFSWTGGISYIEIKVYS